MTRANVAASQVVLDLPTLTALRGRRSSYLSDGDGAHAQSSSDVRDWMTFIQQSKTLPLPLSSLAQTLVLSETRLLAVLTDVVPSLMTLEIA